MSRPRSRGATAVRKSTSTVALPRLSRIFRIVVPSIEGIAEPLDVQRRGPGRELGERDLQRVAARVRGHQGGRSHRNLEGSSPDDAGSLKASIPHENTGSAHRPNGFKGFRGPFWARFEWVG